MTPEEMQSLKEQVKGRELSCVRTDLDGHVLTLIAEVERLQALYNELLDATVQSIRVVKEAEQKACATEVERLQGRVEALEQERNAAYVHAGAVGAAVNECRTEVLKFARAMEERLRANDHKGGWKSEDPTWLLGRMLEEAHELAQAVPDGAVLHEAADVANFCLMVADVCWDWQAGEAK